MDGKWGRGLISGISYSTRHQKRLVLVSIDDVRSVPRFDRQQWFGSGAMRVLRRAGASLATMLSHSGPATARVIAPRRRCLLGPVTLASLPHSTSLHTPLFATTIIHEPHSPQHTFHRSTCAALTVSSCSFPSSSHPLEVRSALSA